MIILTYSQAAQLIFARNDGLSKLRVSLDLGLSISDAVICPDNVCFPSGQTITFPELESIRSDINTCYEITESGPLPIREHSKTTGRIVSLLPTGSAPALMLSGFLMHRIKHTDPVRSVEEMVRSIGKSLKGKILDTATGLGYAAIKMAHAGAKVTTIEIDSAVRTIAAKNPWSRKLFANPSITLLEGDSSNIINGFAEESFDAILHDPPAFDFAGELYSELFYRMAFSVLKRRGTMFHYIGDPESKNGEKVTKGVIRRMQTAGFSKIVPKPEAFGVTGFK